MGHRRPIQALRNCAWLERDQTRILIMTHKALRGCVSTGERESRGVLCENSDAPSTNERQASSATSAARVTGAHRSIGLIQQGDLRIILHHAAREAGRQTSREAEARRSDKGGRRRNSAFEHPVTTAQPIHSPRYTSQERCPVPHQRHHPKQHPIQGIRKDGPTHEHMVITVVSSVTYSPDRHAPGAGRDCARSIRHEVDAQESRETSTQLGNSSSGHDSTRHRNRKALHPPEFHS